MHEFGDYFQKDAEPPKTKQELQLSGEKPKEEEEKPKEEEKEEPVCFCYRTYTDYVLLTGPIGVWASDSVEQVFWFEEGYAAERRGEVKRRAVDEGMVLGQMPGQCSCDG